MCRIKSFINGAYCHDAKGCVFAVRGWAMQNKLDHFMRLSLSDLLNNIESGLGYIPSI